MVNYERDLTNCFLSLISHPSSLRPNEATESLNALIPFVSLNAVIGWLIRQIHDHDWLRDMAGIQNVSK